MENLFGFKSADGTVSAYFDIDRRVAKVHGTLSAVTSFLIADLNSPLRADRKLALDALTMLTSFKIIYV